MNRNVLTVLPSQSPESEQAAAQQQSSQPVKTTPPLQSQRFVSIAATRTIDRERGFLGWWYRLTCPKISPEVAKSLEGREKIRRAQLASLTLLVMCVFTMLPMPVALISNNLPLLIVLFITLAFQVIGLFCNSKGNLALAGFFAIFIFELGFVSFFMSVPGGLSIKQLPAFDILLEGSLVSVAFFRPRSVFVITAINITMVVVGILIAPKAPDLVAYLQSSAYSIFQPSITLELFAAFIIYVWVASAYKAILRADRAEEVADLERREIERQEQEIEQKKQLDYGIDQIMASLNRVANGETNVKVPLDQNNVLWRVGYSINNLLARIHAIREERAELVRTKQVAAILAETLKSGQLPRFDRWTHTCLDELLIELRKVSNWQQPSVGSSANRENVRNS